MKRYFKRIYESNRRLILILISVTPFYLIFGCPARLLTGFCCPGCGMTRALICMLRLDFEAAYAMHPLVFLLPATVAVVLLRHRIPKKILTALGIGAFVLLIAVYAVRLSQGSEVVYWDFEQGAIYKFFNGITN